MSRPALAAALILTLTPASAGARMADPVLEGAWIFTTEARQNNRPICTETWDFGSDGRMEVSSGAERVQKTWRLERDLDGLWLVMTTLSTNHAPDCMGNVTAEIPKGEDRTYLVPLNSGRVLTCPPPGRTPNGAPVVSGCYGGLFPADQAG
ncbi:MAG: hypothetical protein KJ676_02775 [Alphaproteobacteria bacterium]|nr:hypothetical protein [Alphaproteobacteria bacterium]MBU1526582.1 hypothetical protein [Alphaproteobacteria bacterium]MBU2118158.1 hypothetical protein [Alphaproteobacteria bacterium]MBU2351551.1 hypothetical protein [Alphaproteobacteria bacterium]MBU2383170.1 hypothetical protein [Alphaproteobacteria bacterium]